MDVADDLKLPDSFKNIPLDALRVSSRRKLSLYLNLEGSFNEDNNLVNNYNGLAEQVGFTYLEIKNFELQKSPTEDLLHVWTTRPDLNPTVGNLWHYLLEMDRVDVLCDVQSLLFKDCENYLKIKTKFKTEAPIQECTVSQSTDPNVAPDQHVDETLMMTVDDVDKGSPQTYDAFVCYSPEGEDMSFVKQMINTLEGPEHRLKLFVPWRDDLPGASHNTICAKLIESRCKRMVILLSPRYLQSSACDFQTKFAHSLSPGSRSKKLVPVLIEKCNVPQILRHVTLCDFTKTDLKEWFWNRLAHALKAPLDPESCRVNNQSELQSINLDISDRSVWSSSRSLSSLNSSSSSSSLDGLSSLGSTGSSQSGYSAASSNQTGFLKFVSGCTTGRSSPVARQMTGSSVQTAARNQTSPQSSASSKESRVYYC